MNALVCYNLNMRIWFKSVNMNMTANTPLMSSSNKIVLKGMLTDERMNVWMNKGQNGPYIPPASGATQRMVT